MEAALPHQGAGIVNALKVVDYVSTVSPSVLNLNDTANFLSTHEVFLRNTGSEPATYILSHSPGTTSQTKQTRFPYWTAGYHGPVLSGPGTFARAELSTQEITLAGGAATKFSVTFQEPSGLNATLLQVYGGAIHINGTNGENFKVSYMGMCLSPARNWIL